MDFKGRHRAGTQTKVQANFGQKQVIVGSLVTDGSLNTHLNKRHYQTSADMG